MSLEFLEITGIPEIRPGDNLGNILVEAISNTSLELYTDDILAIAQKIVSKAENRLVQLSTIRPSKEALAVSTITLKDARLVELILRESRRIVRKSPNVLITETHHGFICANAGVDKSNIHENDTVTLLPINPDLSAKQIRNRLGCGIIITDTFGRPWREGLVDQCIGIAGPPPLVDLRGKQDRNGQLLSSTVLCQIDALAAAAGILMEKAQGIPAIRIRGHKWTSENSKIQTLLREPAKDLFR